MSKKHKAHKGVHGASPDTRSRFDRARREGRSQAALELAKDLFKAQPTPEHRRLLLDCYLGRAGELRARGMARDAAAVLQTGLNLAQSAQDVPPEWLAQVAEEFAHSGAAAQALALLDRLPEEARPRVLARVADAAVQQEAAGRSLLPEPLRPDFDRVLTAFAHLAAGRDDQAREVMQAVGLKSPFLEWKLLLRGLQAYYARDDARALENWQRLDPTRLPARLAAAYRARIDPSFRAAQPPETQRLLQRQIDQLEGGGLGQGFRSLQAVLSREEELPQAFRFGEALLPQIRQEAPHLVPRLARCFYWAVVHHGQPEDVRRYQRVFGTPPDDPQFHRLRALVLEQIHETEDAHAAWLKFEQSVAANPKAWPGDQAGRVRALVWLHMGRNAASVADVERLAKVPGMPEFLRDFPDRPRPLKPPADVCFQRAVDLAPDLLEAHQALLQYHRDREDDALTERAARQFLQRFPEHAEALEALGDVLTRKGEHDEAVAVFQKAQRANPLDRRPQAKLESAFMYRARAHAEAGRFDAARADYQTALNMARDHKHPVYCKWAACEFKAGDAARAEELLRKALAEAGSRLAVTYSMLIETIRLKLPASLKKRFNDDFNAALAGPADPTAAVELLDTTVSHEVAGVTYRGQKTHEQKVLKYVGKADDRSFSEPQLSKLCACFLALRSARMARRFAQEGRRRFPQNAHFPLLEAESYLLAGPQMCPPYVVGPLLDQALKLAEQMPRDPRQQELVKRIQELQRALRAVTPLLGMFENFFDAFDEAFEDDDGW